MSAWFLIFSILFGILILHIAWCYCCVYQRRSTQLYKQNKFEKRQAYLLGKDELQPLASTASSPTASAPPAAPSESDAIIVSMPGILQIDMPDSASKPVSTPVQVLEVETNVQQSVPRRSREFLEPPGEKDLPVIIPMMTSLEVKEVGGMDNKKKEMEYERAKASVLQNLDNFLDLAQYKNTIEAHKACADFIASAMSKLKSLDSKSTTDESLHEVKIPSYSTRVWQHSEPLKVDAFQNGDRNQIHRPEINTRGESSPLNVNTVQLDAAGDGCFAPGMAHELSRSEPECSNFETRMESLPDNSQPDMTKTSTSTADDLHILQTIDISSSKWKSLEESYIPSYFS